MDKGSARQQTPWRATGLISRNYFILLVDEWIVTCQQAQKLDEP